ncbi:3-oxoacyl-[acyl-carrier-protein] reductase [Lentilactobacillus kefiri]|jgi:3-oxoacyl-[acyl-carrier protein] reductase|uniref:3-oxoacyl-[acyl-carrier-protein] reductase n=2 Tax=Lentilactobacillus kefiri TaxID=33962 RepID=A0A8E1RHS9_LENKE|nr:3-oxoacyl-[acyl-carrier-protein] reductase [Lentilactobacillus kefiri]KRL62210.1 short-chain dehydrogenase reductase SDR [Lentilactobacillus parakefiri DSM 10551]KRM49483.1 short-chain dehydrogenase reductase SDR [Lentilactobacillus kefiri DSM 20587 = JCM 5818]MCJ2161678.1 3-oxoacyl-[acyl-carrier-protein] reductase [Lentilactobacillus kefiri]MCP9368584.1 3-oxoacyl-[acyl-carrier-protein] reductase [Lentilactobacillus kefiri]MDH5107624.1 3-oxoacyl-[acyl-carrier-protein] reductase [Lentilactob
MTETNKVAFITGAAKGIGLSIAKRLADDGMTVVINAHHELSDEQTKALTDAGYDFDVLVGDVADEANAEQMVNAVVEKHGQIDVLVNNAGITKDKLLSRMKTADFKAVLDTNLVGAFNMTKFTMKFMQKARQGAIVNISSISGLHGNLGQANYSSSKAGLVGLTKTAAREGALRGIRSNAVAPGMVKTDMTEKMSERRQNEFTDQIPLKRFAEPDEIADAVAFLVHNQYITGQVITVDGGLTI